MSKKEKTQKASGSKQTPDTAYEDLKKYIGIQLRKGRTEKGLSQKEFSNIFGISNSYYSQIERGHITGSFKLLYNMLTYVGKHITISDNQSALLSLLESLVEVLDIDKLQAFVSQTKQKARK